MRKFVEWNKYLQITGYMPLDESHLLLAGDSIDGNVALCLWNFHTDEELNHTVSFCDYRKIFSDEDLCFLIDGHMIAYPDKFERYEPCFAFLDFATKRTIKGPQLGIWGILSACKLADGSLFYCTDTRGAGVHIVSKEGKELFSNRELSGEREAKMVQELPNGSVAIVYEKEIQIIEPVLVEERYQNILQRGLTALAKSDFYTARRMFECAGELLPEKQDHKKMYLKALRCLRKSRVRRVIETNKATPPLRRAVRLLRQVDEKMKEVDRKILLVGEGGFTFAEAYAKKHPERATHMVATELSDPNEIFRRMKERTAKKSGRNNLWCEIDKESFDEVITRIKKLKKKGVEIQFGVDATEIDQTFSGKHFECIHWNCPFGDPRERESFFSVLPKFFQSAAKIQEIGDRIYIALDQNRGYWKERQLENPLLPAAVLAGYRLVRKRRFNKKRYPGYQFQKTGLYEMNFYAKDGREFVFEKAKNPSQESAAVMAAVLRDYDCEELSVNEKKSILGVREQIVQMMDPDEKNYEVGVSCETKEKGGEYASFHYVCSTDGDSSC